MSTRFFNTVALTSVCMLCFVACDNSAKEELEAAQSKVAQEQKDNDDARAQLALDYQAYIASSNSKLAQNDKDIANLRLQISDRKSKDKASIILQIDALERRNASIKANIVDEKSYTKTNSVRVGLNSGDESIELNIQKK